MNLCLDIQARVTGFKKNVHKHTRNTKTPARERKKVRERLKASPSPKSIETRPTDLTV